jgi:hypothetical protein
MFVISDTRKLRVYFERAANFGATNQGGREDDDLGSRASCSKR